MPKYIKKNCPELEHLFPAIVKTLTNKKSLIIGEGHYHPYARSVLMDLIEAKRVKKLFLELPDDEMTMYGYKQGGKLQDFLQKNIGTKLWENKEWQIIKHGLKKNFKKNKYIQMWTVMEAATYHGAAVYIYDIFGRIPKPTSKDNMAFRNEGMAMVYNKASAGDGIVLLVGDNHNNERCNKGGKTLAKATKLKGDNVISPRFAPKLQNVILDLVKNPIHASPSPKMLKTVVDFSNVVDMDKMFGKGNLFFNYNVDTNSFVKQ